MNFYSCSPAFIPVDSYVLKYEKIGGERKPYASSCSVENNPWLEL